MLTVFCRGSHQCGRIGACTFSCTALKSYLFLGFTGLRVQLSFSAQKSTRNSSKSSFEGFLSCLLCYHIGELKFFTFGGLVCFFYPLFFFPGRLGLFI